MFIENINDEYYTTPAGVEEQRNLLFYKHTTSLRSGLQQIETARIISVKHKLFRYVDADLQQISGVLSYLVNAITSSSTH